MFLKDFDSLFIYLFLIVLFYLLKYFTHHLCPWASFISVWWLSLTVTCFVILTLDFELIFVSSQAEKMLRVFVDGEYLYWGFSLAHAKYPRSSYLRIYLVNFIDFRFSESVMTEWLTLHFQGVCVGRRAWSALVCHPADIEQLTF